MNAFHWLQLLGARVIVRRRSPGCLQSISFSIKSHPVADTVTRDQNMSSPATPTDSAAPPLGLWDVVSIIVGIIVGATIYEMPPLIFGNLARPEYAIGAWVLGGVMSLIGALCYAELATTYPTAGGDYTYLTRAYGPATGFLFAWSELSVIRTGGSIAAMAYVFAGAVKTLPNADFGRHCGMVYATVAIVGLALINLAGLKPGKWTQNLLSLIKC
jgi:amino acid transporter